MQFEHLWIDSYKNLRDLRMEWSNPPYLNAIIGANGSGKSNLIEAILHILIGIYLGRTPPFAFICRYRTQGRLIELRSQGKSAEKISVCVDGGSIDLDFFRARLRDGAAQVYYPDLTFVSYSGTCQRVTDLIDEYYRHFRSITRRPGTDGMTPLFLRSTPEQAQRVLLALCAHAKDSLPNRLGIYGVDDIRIVLDSPPYFHAGRNEPEMWGTQGKIRNLLGELKNCCKKSERKRTKRSSGNGVGPEFQVENYRESRTYYFDGTGTGHGTINLLANRIAKEHGDNLYWSFERFSARGMLNSVKFVIHGPGASKFPFDQISEGEKQLLAVVGAVELTTQRHNLLLLDEPDTHLNPQWLWEYPDLLTEPLHDRQRRCSTVLMATHDPVLVSGLLRNQVWLARRDADGRTSLTHPRRDPRGQGVANLLCSSEFFGLPSSLDKGSQELMDRRLALSVKTILSEADKVELAKLNNELQFLQPGISERDPDYVAFLQQKYGRSDG